MIEIKDLRKSYKTGSFVNKALDGVSIAFRDNEFVAVLGPSGSGKTTLLNVLGGLDHADSGDIVINGTSTKNYRSSDWDTYRNHRIGFIFQSYNLIPHQSVLSNVELALTLSNVSRAERARRAKDMLVKVGLGDHIDKQPNQLSGGQMQRVAIARALINDPDIVLADEPTGALDTETGVQVMDLLSEVAKDRLVIMVTHNPDLAEHYATRIVSFHDGRVVGDTDPIRPDEMPAAGVGVATVEGAEAEPLLAGDARASEAAVTQPLAAADAVVPAVSRTGARPRHSAETTQEMPVAPGGAGENGGRARGKHAAGVAEGAAHAASASASAAAGFSARGGADKGRKASMSFLTALSLSFNNLMTKKGRTFLTAFAGSIGIIGIAAILALSTGVNAYIAQEEEDALTAYPLTITKSSFDLASMLTGMAITNSDEGGAGSDGAAGGSSPARLIPQNSIMTDMFAKVQSNDLVAFKTFLDNGGDGIGEYVNDIEYTYGIKPLIYKTDTSNGLVKLNPSYLSGVLSNGLNTSSFMSVQGNMSSFQEILSNQEMVESQTELLEGRWPEKYDEAVLVLSRGGKLSDYTLYSLGVQDTKTMEDMTKKALNGEDVEVPDDHVDFSYEDAMNLSFKVVPTVATYQRNEETGGWTDMSGDTDFMKARVAEGIDLKVVGVVKTREDASTALLSEGVAYSPELTKRLMQVAADSEIVKQQQANRDVDVFTGKTFEELQNEEGADFDMENMFTVDEDALRNAFSFDTSALSSMGGLDMDLSGLDFDASQLNIDPSKMQIDSSALSQLFDPDAMQKIMEGAPKFTLEESDITDAASKLTPEQQKKITETANSIASGFFAWASTTGKLVPGEQPDYGALFQEYLKENPDAQIRLKELGEEVTEDLGETMNTVMQNYMVNQFGPYMQTAMEGLMTQAGQALATQMGQAMADQMAAATGSFGSAISNAISGQLGSQMAQLQDALQNGFSFDADAFANAIHFNMSQEDLTSLLTNFMNADQLSYDDNLKTLAYASPDNPEAVSIYSKDFPSKEKMLDIIDGYNEKAAADGDDSDAIQYTDIAGVLMSSVTNMVNMISLVLIAFVSISLVVSSIMIGIVTYISVLERKKEIGILRSLGASRGNIANVFNAETVIEGLIAGLFAIAVVLLASIPVNEIVYRIHDVPNVMQLPLGDAAILVAISVVLTFIAGLIPSQKAAHADPVEALRSE